MENKFVYITEYIELSMYYNIYLYCTYIPDWLKLYKLKDYTIFCFYPHHITSTTNFYTIVVLYETFNTILYVRIYIYIYYIIVLIIETKKKLVNMYKFLMILLKY
jgi:hypothetical protein